MVPAGMKFPAAMKLPASFYPLEDEYHETMFRKLVTRELFYAGVSWDDRDNDAELATEQALSPHHPALILLREYHLSGAQTQLGAQTSSGPTQLGAQTSSGPTRLGAESGWFRKYRNALHRLPSTIDNLPRIYTWPSEVFRIYEEIRCEERQRIKEVNDKLNQTVEQMRIDKELWLTQKRSEIS
jgi:hypothetical protein